MPAAVRTKRLVSTALTTTLNTKYTCPAGETAIVKWVAIYNPNAVTRLVSVNVVASGAARPIIRESVPTLTVVRLDLWCVLQPGDLLQMAQDVGSDITVLVAGTELEGVAD